MLFGKGLIYTELYTDIFLKRKQDNIAIFGLSLSARNFHFFFSVLGLSSYKDGVVLLTLLSNDKILDWSKLKVFADNKINVNKVLKNGFGKVENIVGKGENAGY